MKEVASILNTLLQVLVFFLASLLFLPAFLIVTLLQKYWSRAIGELFGV